MKVAVTKKHIKDGTPEDGNECAVALAVQDALKAQGIRNAEVQVNSSEEISVSFSITPNKATTGFIEAFDTTDEPDPRDYEDGENSKEYKADKKKYDKTRAKVKPFEFDLKN